MGLQSFYPQTSEVYQAMNLSDLVICFVFLTEIILRSRKEPGFWKTGWIDLICSIPAIGFFSWEEHYLIFRVLRVVRSFKYLAWFVSEHPRTTRFFAISCITFLFLCCGAMTVFNMEKDAPGATIKTPGDALWWAVCTVTAVGYGDVAPVTPAGRVVASLVIVGGCGFFGMLIAYTTSRFLEKKEMKVDEYRDYVKVSVGEMNEQMKTLMAENKELKALLLQVLEQKK